MAREIGKDVVVTWSKDEIGVGWMTNLYASWFVDRSCDINKVVQRVRWGTRKSNEHAMPKLQRVVLAKLANKARNEKLAVGMGTWDCTVVVSCGHLPFYGTLMLMWTIQQRRWILQPGSRRLVDLGLLAYREEVEGIISPTENASECRRSRIIPTERPRGDYAQGCICLPCTSETVRTPCPTCSVRTGEESIEGYLHISNQG